MERKAFFCGRSAAMFISFSRLFIRASSFFQKKTLPTLKEPSKILLCCSANLGDVFLAASVIPSLRKRFPKCVIGFLCSSASSLLLKDIKGISYIHEVPPFKGIKIGKLKSLFLLLYHSVFIYPKVLKEIRAVRYDVSIELYLFFSNTIPLAKRAGIPRRIGFPTGGYECALTDSIPFPHEVSYLPVAFERLLSSLGVSSFEGRDYCFMESNIVILHLGTSDPRKEWEADEWHRLAVALKEKGFSLVFTGSGKRDRELIKEAKLEDLGKNLIDELSFKQLFLTLKNAKALISVDSLPIHVAAFLKVPFVALYLYSEGVDLWLPNFVYSRLLVQKNCVFMNGEAPKKAICLEKIKWEDVFSHLINLVSELK